MKTQDSKRNKKIRKLVILCALCAVVLTVSTYAWFIGMKTVKVNSFDVDIATTEGLFLSMNGSDWYYNLDAADKTKAYTGNTNTWADQGGNPGLIPLSSVGDVDGSVSTLKLYQKGSLTTTKGGYRLLTSRVDNYSTGVTTEGDGYVAFDLFIKNLSGRAYYSENDEKNEEPIYLTTNSAVKVATSGGVQNTGIENSVRVAFAQIGRVDATDSSITAEKLVSSVTGITCKDAAAADGSAAITGICRDATIWEPNDTAHVTNAINWYNTACRQRKAEGADVTDAASYDTTANCGTIVDGTASKTYAISRIINIADNVDVYDGASYNTYTVNGADNNYATYATDTAPDADGKIDTTKQASYKLVDFPYFTDTMKNKTGMERPTFMSLAPNSITKGRVYIYIEGQDVDNYDFASLGLKVSVNFGFTKERFTETDVNYDTVNSPSTDITPDYTTPVE